MNREELTAIFMMVSNLINPSVSMVYTKIIQRCKGYGLNASCESRWRFTEFVPLPSELSYYS